MVDSKKTALYDSHLRLNGKMTDYYGWKLPVEFEGLTLEHEAVRNDAGIFDVSHMGEIEIKGDDAKDFVDYLVTNDITSLKNNQILYTFFLYPDGGVVDDLLVYKFSDTHYFLVVNASNLEKDYEWIKENRKDYDVEINDLSDKYSEIAIQGPKAEQILQKITDKNLSDIKFFYLDRNVFVDGKKAIVSRTGYTGEDGFEIYLANNDIVEVWEKLLEVGKEEGVKPAGLGARDTLRFEANLPLYGNELSKDITPLEAGLGFFVKLNKESDFIGKEALKKQKEEGLKRKIIGFEMIGKGIPRSGYEVYKDDKKIGFVTTGYHSPTLKKNIGKAMVDIDYADLGIEFDIKIRKRFAKVKVVNTKFLKQNKK
ncbi:glycine cleavage system aminomethyltransferase GcvT [Senegalia massiliensis]|uniref:glycine cleavage system aminomethyltransferase GcvT n=1 Tax=Senegalia massiliensis TaxID=1720316 RepID=UPI0010322A9B|nr:glycine cleavage system aminomethyltransferase GcvT [Senegalia massiliensis]